MMTIDAFKNLNNDDITKMILKHRRLLLPHQIINDAYTLSLNIDNLYKANSIATLELVNIEHITGRELFNILRMDYDGKIIDKLTLSHTPQPLGYLLNLIVSDNTLVMNITDKCHKRLESLICRYDPHDVTTCKDSLNKIKKLKELNGDYYDKRH